MSGKAAHEKARFDSQFGLFLSFRACDHAQRVGDIVGVVRPECFDHEKRNRLVRGEILSGILGCQFVSQFICSLHQLGVFPSLYP